MNYLFRRLTGMFWFLFLGVICAFGINFYSRYEENYKQKLVEFELAATQARDTINHHITVYENVVDESISMFNMYYEDFYTYFKMLPETQLSFYANYEEINQSSIKDNQQLVETLALKKTSEQINQFLSLTHKYYNEEFPIISIKFLPSESTNVPTESFVSDEQREFYQYLLNNRTETELGEGYHWRYPEYYKNSKDKDSKYKYSTLFKAVKLDDVFLGYITVEMDNYPLLNSFTSILNDQLIYLNSVSAPLLEANSEDILPLLSDVKSNNIEQKLIENGYIVRKLSTYDNLIDFYQYMDKNLLHSTVLMETFRLFELNLIILIILFLSVSYILFISIIKPCYLLIEYVKQCGEGNYNIPASITNEWRHPFMTIRNAYLDNERLLALKENQSQELEYAWKKAMVANQAKTHFLAKVSHELKTPLNAIKGYIQLLKMTVDDEKHLKKISIIERSSDLLLNIVTELLDFSRIEEGKIKLIISELNMIQVSEMLEGFFINDITNKNLEYEIIVDHLIPTSLYGDESRIKQIIINLVSNAIKFTDNGKITVIFKLDNIDKDYAFVEIKVCDTGKGIVPEKLDAIFESFTQENNSISRKYGGTGLGLSISKGLADVMGGSLTVESEVGIGSTFTFFLPLAINPIDEEEN